jgi:PTH1 family peptidyl-tRNA hydrolase
MELIVGLGNPGEQYAATWHNAGWMALDSLAAKHGLGAFSSHKKSQSLVSKNQLAGQDIILAKPQTFMNKSGQAVAALVQFFKVNPEQVWLVHDEIDLPLGTLRIARGGSDAGHKGVKSVIASLGTKDIVRFRIGVQTPSRAQMPTDAYVLKTIDPEYQDALDEAILRTATAIEIAIIEGVEKAMNQFN